jgi:hypothetical protein
MTKREKRTITNPLVKNKTQSIIFSQSANQTNFDIMNWASQFPPI